MRKLWILAALAIFLSGSVAYAEWEPNDPLLAARAAADHELFGKIVRDEGTPEFDVHHNLIWEDATLMSGVFRLVDRLEEKGGAAGRYVDYLSAWGSRHPGVFPVPIVHGDLVCAGETYMWLYERSGKTSDHLRRTNGMVDFIYYSRKPAQWGTGHNDYWMRFWNDDIHMVPPFLAFRGRAVGNKGMKGGKDGRTVAMDYCRAYADVLRDPETGLFWHDRGSIGDYMWGRGNGWAAAGYTKVLDVIKDVPGYEDDAEWLRERLVEMAETLKLNRNTYGTWNADVLNRVDYVVPETSGSNFFTYMMAYLINEGTLDEEYIPIVKKAWRFLTLSLRDDGGLMHVQPVGRGPVKKDFQEHSESYGVGGFLMTAVEMHKLYEKVGDDGDGVGYVKVMPEDFEQTGEGVVVSAEALGKFSGDVKAVASGQRLPETTFWEDGLNVTGLPPGYDGPLYVFYGD